MGMEAALTDAPKKTNLRRWFRVIAHEPFFQFILLGFLIWAGVEVLEARNARYTIHVGPAELQRIALAYLQQFEQPPAAEQLQELIDRYVREEIFLREGLALNLDRGDEIVRRRIAQKYEFLQTDLAVPDQPAPGALEHWFEENKSRYLTPQRVSFSQVYLSPDKAGDEAAQARALELLRTLEHEHAVRAADRGDPFPGPVDAGAVGPAEAERLFGQSALVDKLFEAPVGQWSGPFRSGYGWHLIYVTGVQPPTLPSLRDIQDRVLADYRDEQRRLLNAAAYAKLRAKYTILREGNAE